MGIAEITITLWYLGLTKQFCMETDDAPWDFGILGTLFSDKPTLSIIKP